jgi:hypothetical protein
VDTARTVLVQRQTFEEAVMNLRVPKETMNFLTISRAMNSEEFFFHGFLLRFN